MFKIQVVYYTLKTENVISKHEIDQINLNPTKSLYKHKGLGDWWCG